jgi:hypothetical protein
MCGFSQSDTVLSEATVDFELLTLLEEIKMVHKMTMFNNMN